MPISSVVDLVAEVVRLQVLTSGQRTELETVLAPNLAEPKLLVLASAIMPMTRVTMQRMREAELRRALREMRTAIDKFKDAADLGQIGATDLKAGAENYPPDLDTLVEGVSAANDQTGRKLKFLRRVPRDPMTKSTDWGLRSYQDEPDTSRWGGQDVFDVRSKSQGTALDGSKYKDW